MKPCAWCILLAAMAAIPGVCGERIPIATAPGQGVPHGGSGIAEPVVLSGYFFEVNPETRRARIVVEYAWKNPAVLAGYDFHGSPSTYLQPDGLAYDAGASAVVYTRQNHRTICATLRQGKGLFRRQSWAGTNACVVTGSETEHSGDDGWSMRKVRVIELFLEIR